MLPARFSAPGYYRLPESDDGEDAVRKAISGRGQRYHGLYCGGIAQAYYKNTRIYYCRDPETADGRMLQILDQFNEYAGIKY